MNTEFSRILERQTVWARQRELEIGNSRHAPTLRDNLYRELAAATLAELGASERHPLGDPGLPGDRAKPGDLQLLESTRALVCNVFEPTREAPGALAALCGGDSATETLRFCARLETDGLACEIDLLFDTDMTPGSPVGRPTAVAASYAEPYRSRRPRQEPANRISSQWLEASDIWRALPTCHRLALDLRATPRRFEHIAAADLLAASTCLTARYGYRGFRLVHVWFDAGGASAAKYRRELDRFRFRVGGEIDFRALTWQQLVASLSTSGAPSNSLDAAQLGYLRSRYGLG
jgi:hypothetical protein